MLELLESSPLSANLGSLGLSTALRRPAKGANEGQLKQERHQAIPVTGMAEKPRGLAFLRFKNWCLFLVAIHVWSRTEGSVSRSREREKGTTKPLVGGLCCVATITSVQWAVVIIALCSVTFTPHWNRVFGVHTPARTTTDIILIELNHADVTTVVWRHATNHDALLLALMRFK